MLQRYKIDQWWNWNKVFIFMILKLLFQLLDVNCGAGETGQVVIFDLWLKKQHYLICWSLKSKSAMNNPCFCIEYKYEGKELFLPHFLEESSNYRFPVYCIKTFFCHACHCLGIYTEFSAELFSKCGQNFLSWETS